MHVYDQLCASEDAASVAHSTLLSYKYGISATLWEKHKIAKHARTCEKTSLDDLLAFEGDDLCIIVFSSAVDDETNRYVVTQYADLAQEVRRNTKKLKFVAYELNMLGPH